MISNLKRLLYNDSMKRETLTLPMSDIKLNDSNPRIIKDRQMKRLVRSIQDFPEMTELRPIVIDENNVILGGNMRYRAMQSLGYERVEVVKVSGLSDEQKREFIIKDNVPFGDWDWDELANSWNAEKLNDWGLDFQVMPNLDDFFIDNNENKQKNNNELICPNCGYKFEK